MKKRLIISIIFVVLILVLLVLGLKYGWRLFGYRFCESPDVLGSKCEVENTFVRVQGMTSNSAKKFDGYKWEIENGVLYLGIHCKTFFASSNLGTFDITIDTPQKISKVIIKGHGAEQEIYSAKTE